jgi:hypothetical protein
MAMPRLPGCSGSSASILRPVSVSSDGLRTTLAPNVSITERRYGLPSYEAPTCQTLHSSPYCAQANASAVPHCPAPVSVVSVRTPLRAL